MLSTSVRWYKDVSSTLAPGWLNLRDLRTGRRVVVGYMSMSAVFAACYLTRVCEREQAWRDSRAWCGVSSGEQCQSYVSVKRVKRVASVGQVVRKGVRMCERTNEGVRLRCGRTNEGVRMCERTNEGVRLRSSLVWCGGSGNVDECGAMRAGEWVCGASVCGRERQVRDDVVRVRRHVRREREWGRVCGGVNVWCTSKLHGITKRRRRVRVAARMARKKCVGRYKEKWGEKKKKQGVVCVMLKSR